MPRRPYFLPQYVQERPDRRRFLRSAKSKFAASSPVAPAGKSWKRALYVNGAFSI
jgi:hypothetical protein